VLNLYATTPSWYYNLPIKATSYIGYGQGSSEDEAKKQAINDIASQISTKVDNKIVQNKRLSDGKYKKQTDINSSQTSKALLSDTKVIKTQSSDGVFYVAIEYINLPTIDKFINKIKRVGITTKPLNSYLSKTSIAKSLYKKLNQDIYFELVRKDAQWFIQHNIALQILTTKDLSKLYKTLYNDNLEIKLNNNREVLYEGDEFCFDIKSSKSGYISIISVYEDGTVATLVKNIKIKADKSMSIPDTEFESYLEAGLIKPKIETYDLYIVLYSKDKLALDSFASADEELITDERYKNFDELINYIDNKEYATLKVVTKPR